MHCGLKTSTSTVLDLSLGGRFRLAERGTNAMSKTPNETNRELRESVQDEEARDLIHMAKRIGFSEFEIEELDRLYAQKLEDTQ